MDLHECYAKSIFAEYGIPVPRGLVARSADQARAAAVQLGVPVMLKIQVRIGGRGKAGGVRSVADFEEAGLIFTELLRLEAQGHRVNKILVEEKLKIQDEYYLAITIDWNTKQPVLLISSRGGMNIEELAKESGASLATCTIDPLIGLAAFQIRGLLNQIAIPRAHHADFIGVALNLYRLFRDQEATLAEINPLALTADGRLVAADAKLTIDDGALARQNKAHQILSQNGEDFPEDFFKLQHGFDYLEINPEGDIGVVSTGAGGSMLTLDLIAQHGGQPLNFVDLRTGSLNGNPTRLVKLLQTISARTTVRGILVNVFGGVTDMGEFADCFLRAWQIAGVSLPIVVRIEGNNVEAGQAIFTQEGLPCFSGLEPAIKEIIRITH